VLHWDAKIRLLRYFVHQPKLELLDKLELLPLANGGWVPFYYNPRHADRPIYVVTSNEVQDLLFGLNDDFMDLELDKDIKKLLIKAVTKG